MQKHTIWHSWYADALATIHQAPAGIDYADLTIKREGLGCLPAFCQDEDITQEIPAETMQQVVCQRVAS